MDANVKRGLVRYVPCMTTGSEKTETLVLWVSFAARTEPGELTAMDTTKYISMVIALEHIESSWRNTWAVLFGLTKACITRMATDPTTELRTLNCGLDTSQPANA
jgi:hypothetical protein